MHHALRVAALTLGTALAASHAAAQAAPPAPPAHPRSIGLMAGATQFDLSGTGTSWIASVRGDIALQRWLLAEGAVSTFRPDEQFGLRRTYLVPEAQLQLQLPSPVVRPYLGVGGGYVFVSDRNRMTASAATGVRVVLQAIDLRGELRVRGFGRNFGGAAAEWMLGASYRL